MISVEYERTTNPYTGITFDKTSLTYAIVLIDYSEKKFCELTTISKQEYEEECTWEYQDEQNNIDNHWRWRKYCNWRLSNNRRK